MLMLSISNNDSVFNFYKNIGFLSEKKNKKIKFAASLVRKYKRVNADSYSHILRKLKENVGTDQETIEVINTISEIKYSYRQFEHMRRGESSIPIDMVNAVLSLLGRENEKNNRYEDAS
jgi:hypothetical protein